MREIKEKLNLELEDIRSVGSYMIDSYLDPGW